jgi:lipoate-protein ligase A
LRAEYKVPGGKLIAAETEVEVGRLARIKITGDFFMHPEEAIEELEEALTGIILEEGSLEKAVEDFFSDHTMELIGVSPGDFVKVVKMSLGSNPP